MDMNHWITSHGRLQISGGAIRISVADDLARFYKSFVDKAVLLNTHPPAHGCHITVWNPKLFGQFDAQKGNMLRAFYKNKPIKFEYDPTIIEGGSAARGFRNWFLRVRSVDIDHMTQALGLNGRRDQLHITVCNTKNGATIYAPDLWKTIK